MILPVVTCMGRLEHLRQTLPLLVADFGRAVLVDWSCPDNAGMWARCELGSAVEVVNVPGQRHFHKTRALNLGGRRARELGAEWIFFLDADTLVAPGVRRACESLAAPGQFGLGDRIWPGPRTNPTLTGVLLVSRADFERVSGYDEEFRDYGYEDTEMRCRLRLRGGLRAVDLPANSLASIPHDDGLRARFHVEGLHASSPRNDALLRARIRSWVGRDLEAVPEVRELLNSAGPAPGFLRGGHAEVAPRPAGDLRVRRSSWRRAGGRLIPRTIPSAGPQSTRATARHRVATKASPARESLSLSEASVRAEMTRAAENFAGPPRTWRGTGIVIPAGGRTYFTNAWICVRMLRHLGCDLPIQFWHLGEREMTREMRGLVEAFDVECVDAEALRGRFPIPRLAGYELKAYALYHSEFEDVLLLDADNMPLADPTFLFTTEEYRTRGAIFWPDYGDEWRGPPRRLNATHPIWRLTGLPYLGAPEFESGQVCINKRTCARELGLALWMNEHSDFFYRYIHGDKDTFHLAWRFLGRPYAMPADRPVDLGGLAMGQRDFDGRILFQHRNVAKWTLDGTNANVQGFEEEETCRGFLEDLRARWDLLEERRRAL